MQRVVTLLFALAVPAVAAGQSYRVYAHSGAAFPMGPRQFIESWGTGVNLGAALGYQVVGPVEVRASVGFSAVPISRDKLLVVGADLDIDGGAYRVAHAGADVRFELERGSWFRPYLVGGAAAYRITIADLSIRVRNPEAVCTGDAECDFRFGPAEKDPETAMGFRVGAGVAYYVGDRSWLFVEPVYHVLFTDDGTLRLLPLHLGFAHAW